jgi:Ca2+-binding EF-hand superfamily protein
MDEALLHRLEVKKTEFRAQQSRKAFSDADKDGSGYLDPQEFQALCWKLHGSISPEEIAASFSRIDTSGDGRVSFDEFHLWWASDECMSLRQRLNASAGIDDTWDTSDLEARMMEKRRGMDEVRLRRQFERVDEDGSGIVEYPEFRRLCRTLAAHLSEEEVAATFAAIDVDGSGGCSFPPLVRST